jgi:hypothetical protein
VHSCAPSPKEKIKTKTQSQIFFLFLSGTGEHGVGIGKKEFLVEELGPGTVGLMKTIKQAIDPLGIMNPGKVRGPDADSIPSVVQLLRGTNFSALPGRRGCIPHLRA